MSNFIKWNGEAEDETRVYTNAQDAHKNNALYFEYDGAKGVPFKWNWGAVPLKWGDVQLLIEAVQVGGKSYTREERQKKLDNWLDKEPEKKKRLLTLVATVNGQNYTETKEVDEVKVKISDVELLIKEIFSRLIVEKQDV